MLVLGCLVYLLFLSAPATPGWQKIWTEEFDGPAGGGINQQTWKYDVGQGIFGTGEIETMTASPYNVHLDGGGNLNIVAVRYNGTWSSGRIQTRRLFAPPRGGQMMVSASIRQPDPAHGVGYWPAFWMLGPGTWPTDGEIDILEDINALSQHSGTFHCGNLWQANGDGTFGPCRETAGLGSGPRPCPGCQQAFHTYSVVIDRRNESDQQIRWYLDGGEFFSVSEGSVGRAPWTAAVDHGFSIILNLAVGGAYPDAVCRCVSPTAQTTPVATMAVRYVAVYTR